MLANISAEMRFALSTQKKAESAFKAIMPEMSGKHEKRAQTKAMLKKNHIAFSITAEDLTALKTSMNSFAKSIELIKDLIGG